MTRVQSGYPLRQDLWDPLHPTVKEFILSREEENRTLRRQVDSLRGRVQTLEAKVEVLLDELKRTRLELEAARRAAKRQAAPFSRGEPKTTPRKPGRKHGHKPAYRPIPSHVDETIELTLERCPHCHGPVEADQVEEQYVEDLPPVRPYVRKFIVYSGYCPRCKKRVRHPAHPGQVSCASGAAGVQIGSRVIAYAADLKHRLGIPYRKVSDIFQTFFGLSVTAGGIVHATVRLAKRVAPAHQAICRALQCSTVVYADETGWRIGGHSAWLWVFTNKHMTVYVIRQSRGHEVAEELLGKAFAGVLVSDCLATYDPLPYRKGKCIGHLIKELSELVKSKKGTAVRFPRETLALFRKAMNLKKIKPDRSPSAFKGLVTGVEKRLNGLLLGTYTDPDNRRLAERFRKQRAHLFTFLYYDEVEPTNNRAERQIRPAVIIRKISAGNRTARGVAVHEVLTTIIVTCSQQGNSFLSLAQSALRLDGGAPWPEFPQLPGHVRSAPPPPVSFEIEGPEDESQPSQAPRPGCLRPTFSWSLKAGKNPKRRMPVVGGQRSPPL